MGVWIGTPDQLEQFQVVQPSDDLAIMIDNIEDTDSVPSFILRNRSASVMFRISVDASGNLRIQSKGATESWDEAEDLMVYSGGVDAKGASEGQFTDEYLSDLADHMLVHMAAGSKSGLKLRETIQTGILL